MIHPLRLPCRTSGPLWLRYSTGGGTATSGQMVRAGGGGGGDVEGMVGWTVLGSSGESGSRIRSSGSGCLVWVDATSAVVVCVWQVEGSVASGTVPVPPPKTHTVPCSQQDKGVESMLCAHKSSTLCHHAALLLAGCCDDWRCVVMHAGPDLVHAGSWLTCHHAAAAVQEATSALEALRLQAISRPPSAEVCVGLAAHSWAAASTATAAGLVPPCSRFICSSRSMGCMHACM